MLWPWIYIVGEGGGDVDFLLLETIFSVISTAYVMSAVWLYVISSGEMLYSVYKIGRPKKETHTARTSFPAVMMFLLTIQKVYIYTTHCIYRRCSWFSFVLFLALSFFFLLLYLQTALMRKWCGSLWSFLSCSSKDSAEKKRNRLLWRKRTNI